MKKELKIGILTYHKTTNYGAIFQAYALQKFINSKKIDCEIIDYNNKILIKRYNFNPLKSSGFKEFSKKAMLLFPNWTLKRKFIKFAKNNIKISSENYNEKNIKSSDKFYDSFISGSDQVWNLELSGYDKNYFMMFTEDRIKRNSYAASIGKNNFNSEIKKELLNLINNQNKVSLREIESVDYVQKLGIKPDISNHIDPVFLITKEEWESLSIYQKNSPYIFVYEVTRTNYLREFAVYLAKKKNLKIVFISGSSKKIPKSKKIKSASPEEFLGYIKNAEYVVTSSFHGMALSIIFNKKFFYDIPDQGNGLGTRLESLAQIFDLKSRKIPMNFNDYEKKEINYEKINQKINKEKNISSDYIDEIIKDIEDSKNE